MEAERLGLDAVYLGESPTSLNAETWTSLGLVAASTTTLRFGPVIANLLDDYRSPVLLARQAATLALAAFVETFEFVEARCKHDMHVQRSHHGVIIRGGRSSETQLA